MSTAPDRSDARLVLLRHGETEWSVAGRHTGRTDIPLTAAGAAQARELPKLLERLALRNPLVLTSPRLRARHTAELAELNIDREWADLAEWDYGDYEGLTTPQIRQHVAHWTVWTRPCPHGETPEAVGARADTVLSVVEPQLAERDVVLVGHGHFSRVLIARWTELSVVEGRRFAMNAGSITVLGYEHENRAVLAHNLSS